MPRPGLVFGGVPIQPLPRLAARVAALDHPLVVAADAGAASALAFGLTPHLVVGDLDSIQPSLVPHLRSVGARIEPHPTDKDATDGQLAAERARALGADVLLLLGYLRGPRLDHALANVTLLASLPAGTVLLDEQNECRLLRGGETAAWQAEAAERISLIPLSNEALGITTSGLRWSLSGASLRLGETRGVSNEPLAAEVAVRLGAGLLLVTRHFPEADGGGPPI